MAFIADTDISEIQYKMIGTSIGTMAFPLFVLNNENAFNGFTNTNTITAAITAKALFNTGYTTEGGNRVYHTISGNPPANLTFKIPSIPGLEFRCSSTTSQYQTQIVYYNDVILNTVATTQWSGTHAFFIAKLPSGKHYLGLFGGYRGTGNFTISVEPSGGKFGIFEGVGISYASTNSWYYGTGGAVAAMIAGQSTKDTGDPFSPDGNSGTGGGTGNFDGTGDDIDIPGLPTISATDTGFITIFNPSVSELHALANYMWTNSLFDVDTWKKIFANPMDAILGLSIVPVAVPNGGQSAVTVGNISTGVSMNKAAAQYVSIDCGTLNVNEYWGAYLDYDPYTKAEIYLPYIGTHPLSVDDIMNKSVHVVYHVDILSGACIAFVKCGGSVLYSFVGQCAASIPITGNDWTNVINGVMSVATSIGTMVATGGATAPLSVGAIASTAFNSMKPNIEKSGSLGGTGGMLGIQTPYLILTRPRQCLPSAQNSFSGYPSFITSKLSSLSGYTEIDSIHLENVPATEQELSEIVELLNGGVIL